METTTNSILIDLDEIIPIVKRCWEEDKTIKKSFYDWYLFTENFFIKSGKFHIGKIILEFDLNIKNQYNFQITEEGEIKSKFNFNKMDNTDFAELKIGDYILYDGFTQISFSQEYNDIFLKKINERLLYLIKNQYARKGFRKPKYKDIFDKAKGDVDNYIYMDAAKRYIRIFFALMFNCSEHKPEIIYGVPNSKTENNQPKELVKTTYKYDGYIDLMPDKVYRSIIKKEAAESDRDYQRHINAWQVRGHYRNTSKGLIWIDSFVKGDGELEQRIYADYKPENITEKVFDVYKKKPFKNTINSKFFLKEPKINFALSLKEYLKNNYNFNF